MTITAEFSLISHLLRRAGLGSSYDELQEYAELGYEAAVEKLLNPKSNPNFDYYEFIRRHPQADGPPGLLPGQMKYFYFLLNTKRPLEEKMALFWHQVFATGYSKVNDPESMLSQMDMFREEGMGNYRTLLIKLAQDPAMIFWLDNNENHKNAPNENWGRELLELFSLGVGNYTEEDVYECSRAFTGWTAEARMPVFPYGRHPWKFEFRSEDHDYSEKTFLGHTGNFDGEDIIDIILEQEACPRFIARHLYNFFVEDEPQVPAWNIEPPNNPEAVEYLADLLVESNYEIKPVLRELFNSDFFKESAYKRVRSPIELIVGTLRLAEDLIGPDPRVQEAVYQPGFMGQELMDPPSVEGWHTGKEWINSGALVKRVNFVSDTMSDVTLPGVKKIIGRVAEGSATMSPEVLVERCLEFMGPLPVKDKTRQELIDHAMEHGEVGWDEDSYEDSAEKAAVMLALIASTREYQFG